MRECSSCRAGAALCHDGKAMRTGDQERDAPEPGDVTESRLSGPMLILVSGLPGVGKSVLVQELAPRLAAGICSRDAARLGSDAGGLRRSVEALVWRFAGRRLASTQQRAGRILESAVAEQLESNGSVIVEAVAEDALRQRLQETGAPIWRNLRSGRVRALRPLRASSAAGSARRGRAVLARCGRQNPEELPAAAGLRSNRHPRRARRTGRANTRTRPVGLIEGRYPSPSVDSHEGVPQHDLIAGLEAGSADSDAVHPGAVRRAKITDHPIAVTKEEARRDDEQTSPRSAAHRRTPCSGLGCVVRGGIVIGESARYLLPVETIGPGDLVRVAGRGPDLDGIVFDVPSHSKVVVAVVEPGRGPTFRTVHPVALTERAEEGPDDRALRLLLGRTPSPVHDAARGGGRGGRGRAGHTRAPSHRTTGR